MNFDKADMTQGIFFVSVADPTKEYRVMHYSRIKPSEINFLIPEMEAGEYKVVIRTLHAENKEPISGILLYLHKRNNQETSFLEHNRHSSFRYSLLNEAPFR